MGRIIPGFVIALISVQAFGQRDDYWLLVHDKSDEYGYVDKNGVKKIPLGKYSVCYTDTFRNYAIVAYPQKGLVAINKKGEKLFEVYSFDNRPDKIREGLFRIVNKGLIGFANSGGKVVIKPRFKFAFPFSDGLAGYCEDCVKQNDGIHSYWAGGKWGFIDKNGDVIIRPSYESIIRTFIESKAKVKLNGEEFWIDKQGNGVK
ncbi:MAG TPA: WG repeat-containing protein [Cyclobacteriaceae bacterium]|nr:WG repeat-containing protein [Cyclobacteriaceae bacterium]